MKLISTIIAVLWLVACRSSFLEERILMDFGAFSIKTPQSWKQIKQTGVDSYVGGIVVGSSDTIQFDLGWYSNSLTEYDPFIVERAQLQQYPKPLDTTDMIIVENRRVIDMDDYRKNNVMWDSIDGRKAKIVYPRKPGVGITGVYIDHVSESNGFITRFNLYGEDLQPGNEKILLEVVKTLRFRKQ